MYAEEWKAFWEERYRELQLEGKDPDSHDFKAEWIPHWGNKVSQIFEKEVCHPSVGCLNAFMLTRRVFFFTLDRWLSRRKISYEDMT